LRVVVDAGSHGGMMLLALLVACSGGSPPAAPTPKPAEAPAAEAPPAAPAAPAAAVNPMMGLQKLPASGSVGATAAKITRSHEIAFSQWEGYLGMKGLDLAAVDLKVQVDSLDTDEVKLVNHLKTPDLLDVATYKYATFTSTSIKPGVAPELSEVAKRVAGANSTVEGDLSIHGVTRHVVVPATITVTPDSVMANAVFPINRQDYGVKYPGMPDDLIKDEVVLNVSLIANRANVVADTPANP